MTDTGHTSRSWKRHFIARHDPPGFASLLVGVIAIVLAFAGDADNPHIWDLAKALAGVGLFLGAVTILSGVVARTGWIGYGLWGNSEGRRRLVQMWAVIGLALSACAWTVAERYAVERTFNLIQSETGANVDETGDDLG